MIYLMRQRQLQKIISGVLLNAMGLNDACGSQHHK